MALWMDVKYRIEMDCPLANEALKTVLIQNDDRANRIVVELVRRGQPVSLEGASAVATLTRADGAEVRNPATVEGNTIFAPLQAESYSVPGACIINVKLTTSGGERTVLRLTGYVERSGGGVVIDPTGSIPSYDDLARLTEELQQGVAAADAATKRADTAAKNADDMAMQAETAALEAGHAADRADLSAQSATEAAEAAMQRAADAANAAEETANAAATAARETANAAAATANEAADRAVNAAAYIEGTTVSAHKLAPGSEPTAEASTVDGHMHVEYGLVTGDKGEQGPGYTIKGPAYATVEALAASVTAPEEGDQYNVGIAPPYNIYRWTGLEWEDQGALQGPPGDDGAPGPGVADGGATGQVLTKASDADFDTAWKSIPAVEYEAQALTEAQKAQARSNVDAASAGEVGTISESVTALDGVVSKIGEAKVASATVEATEGFQTVIEFPLEIGHTYLVVANIYTSVGDSTNIMLSLEALNAGNYNGAFTNRGSMESGGGITASMIVKAVSDESKAVVKSYKYSSKSYNYIVRLQTVIIK